jgi:hypothetical protein
MMKLNVGLCRKVGEPGFSSRGASLNLELEIDSGLAAEPGKLHAKIRELFSLVQTSLAEEVNGGHAVAGNGTPQTKEPVTPTTPTTVNGRQQQRGVARSATLAQVKALFGIARQKGVDLKALLQNRCQVQRADDLTVRQASTLIDELRSMEERAGEG